MHRELLSVRTGGEEFAIDIMSVREIRGWSASTPLPHAPSYIKGMINLRGVVLAIVDLADRLGLAPTEPVASSVVVVVQLGDRTVGLLVDAVSDIINVTDEMIQAAPDMGHKAIHDIVQGVLTIEDRIVSILSLPALVPTEALEAELAA